MLGTVDLEEFGMALPVERLGEVFDELVADVDADRCRAYASATNDPNPLYASGAYAPPVFGVVPTWEAISQGASLLPPEAAMMIVHGEQDMHFHQPLVPGARLRSRAEAYNIRVGSSGTRCTIRVMSTDDGGKPLLEQYVTMFVRGMTDGESGGPEKPDHTFPEDARARRVGSATVHVDDDQTFRYRDASGDLMPIHTDEAVAKAVGLPGIIAHGLCTMAMASQVVIGLTAGGDPAALRRLAVRFSKNVFPGDDLTTTVYDGGQSAGRRIHPFETATQRGDLAITNGWAEVGSRR